MEVFFYGTGKVLTIDDLVEALDMRERSQSNVPKVNTFHFNGERVSDWLDLVEQALVGLSDAVKFQRTLKYVLHGHYQEVKKVVNAANGSWARFEDGMQRKYRMGDGLLTTADLEAMNREDFTIVGTFVQEFKKKARKVPGISEEAKYAIFLGLLTTSEAAELTSHGGGSAKLTWATIDKGVEEGSWTRWIAPRGYQQKAELVLKPFEEEDPWGGKDVQWMMKLALACTHSLVEEPTGDMPQEEVHEPEREIRQSVERGRTMEEVIEVEEDTPPQEHAAELEPDTIPEIAREEGEEPQQEEMLSPPPEAILSPGVRIEMERERTGWRREAISTIDRYLAAHAQEHPNIEEPVPTELPREPRRAEGEMGAEIPERADHRTKGRVPAGETAEEKWARVGKRMEEIWQERQRSEAAGALPDQPPGSQPKPCRIKEMWDELFGQHGEGLAAPERAGLGTSRMADLAVGLPLEPPMGRVILEPEEAKARREAEREAFEFRAPSELATLPTAVVEPMTMVMPLPIEGGQQTTSSEPIQGTREGSMDVLVEAIDTMQEEASLFSPEQRVEGPPEREVVIVMEDVIEGKPQRLDTPE
ncbi:hypothetical protein CBR_g40271 [Chara braunii]|uniref:Retrotransposon gag domain-containing protein n=1 Tax=Chara braunii TaxID=69332 RepID=A0A388K1Y5_CHABU|nr:hypothetical protein CBR_g40271 [Chara braunii]|eukprot:GBG64025.1 hypothetical protein CBR_g40271 [Chara braunii]